MTERIARAIPEYFFSATYLGLKSHAPFTYIAKHSSAYTGKAKIAGRGHLENFHCWPIGNVYTQPARAQ